MSENNQQFDLSALSQLRDDERIEARAQARDNLLQRAGGLPQYDDFVRAVPSRFGKTAERLTLAVLMIVLAAAFAISAVHIYAVGRSTYLQGADPDARIAVVIGAAFVILAEAAMLSLSVVPTVWETPPRVSAMMYAGIIGSAFVATIGNIDATIFYTESPFDWIRAWINSFATAPNRWALATLPPFLTVLVGQGIKYQLLTRSRERNEARIEYARALQDYDRLAANIEQHPDWLHAYAGALWDRWRRGKRRDLIAQIDIDLRRAIVAREMAADRWFVPGGFQWNPVESSGTKTESSEGRGLIDQTDPTRSMQERVKQVLTENPELLDMKRVDAAGIIGVSIGSLQRGIDLYQRNGNGIHTE